MGPNNLPVNTSAGLNTSLTERGEAPSELTQVAAQFVASVTQFPADFSGRCHDTRTKQKPTGNDIANVNTTVCELLKSNALPNPTEDPFGYLWTVNCILYSVVIAFLVCKGWEKKEIGME